MSRARRVAVTSPPTRLARSRPPQPRTYDAERAAVPSPANPLVPGERLSPSRPRRRGHTDRTPRPDERPATTTRRPQKRGAR